VIITHLHKDLLSFSSNQPASGLPTKVRPKDSFERQELKSGYVSDHTYKKMGDFEDIISNISEQNPSEKLRTVPCL